MSPVPPSYEIIKYFNHFYIDTSYTNLPPQCFYKLYPQPSRHMDAQGSYIVYLPPGYDKGSDRYPVLYWLHGGMQTQRQGLWAMEFYNKAMEQGKMPKTIIAAPQALPVGWYVNSKDGSRPLANIISRDFVTHIDSSYRTIPLREARWLEGWSMGGYGTLHLGFSQPENFGALSMIKGSILRDLHLEPVERTADTFFGDQAYYDKCHPVTLLEKNASALSEGNTLVRLLHGAQDLSLCLVYSTLVDMMGRLGTSCKEVKAEGVADDFGAILEAVGDYSTGFWEEAYRNVRLERSNSA